MFQYFTLSFKGALQLFIPVYIVQQRLLLKHNVEALVYTNIYLFKLMCHLWVACHLDSVLPSDMVSLMQPTFPIMLLLSERHEGRNLITLHSLSPKDSQVTETVP